MLQISLRFLHAILPRAAVAILGILTLAGSFAVHADQQDTISYSVGLTHQYDNNLFRLPSGVNPQPLVGKSARDDRITTATLGIKFSKAYSLQQLEASYEHISNRYDTYDFLNHDADNFRGAWRWQLTPRLTGNLTANRTQALVSFGDFRNYNTRNLRTNTAFRADADWNVFRNGWHLRGGVERNRTSNSQVFVQDEGSEVTGADLGLRYVFPSSNWIDYVSSTGQGTYLGRRLDPVNQLDDGFRDTRNELRIYWLAHGKSLIEGSVGYLARNNNHYSSRDYSGGVGSLKWTWTPTGKLALVVSWKRDMAAYTDVASSYYLQDVYSISPMWQVSAKIRLSLKFDHNTRDFRGPVTLLPVTARHERSDTAQFVAEWTPLRALNISGYLIEDRREANQAGFSYQDRIAGANVRLDF
jgi:exopolysaccharide biosynthesis operon protein EpsL